MQQDSRHPYKADPYRAARKPPSPDGYYESPSFTSEQIHSRSPSESSITRLAVSSPNNNNNNNNNNNKANTEMYGGGEEYDYCNQQDPYAPRQGEKKKKKKNRHHNQSQHQQRQQEYYHHDDHPEKRANSYLPYTNHKRDPYDPVEPIYLQEDDDLPSFNSPNSRHGNHGRGPVGSILQDNIVMDMMTDSDYYAPNQQQHDKKEENIIQTLPPNKKKRWWSRLGISGRKLVFIVFAFIAVVVIIWYFVWPRTPTLTFLEAGLLNTASYTNTTVQATWSVNFTVNNQANWIPTNIQNFAVSVLDASTSETFGTGNTGHLMLTPRTLDQIINVPIYINFTRDPTNPTLLDLLNSCTMLNQDLASPLPKQTLDISFVVVYYIAGISWHAVSTFSPSSYFQCPMTIS